MYHLASPASPKFYQSTPFGTIDVNISGTRNMLELAKQTNAEVTSKAYGAPEVHPKKMKHIEGSKYMVGTESLLCEDIQEFTGTVHVAGNDFVSLQTTDSEILIAYQAITFTKQTKRYKIEIILVPLKWTLV
ncbi:hypothetical protein QUF99_09305 [Bacillus sp. DX4.1]|nr:hypothetical protein [Bacillus sp. DX4.1]MDM5187511.1 hypothetical protein [Bacillus sp. DX4.1]